MILGHTVGLVIPCHNEAAGLRTILPSVPPEIDDVIVVDNNSTDDTTAVARAHGARVVTETIPGYGSAYQAGFAAAATEIVVTLDGDGQYPVTDIPRLVGILLERKLDFLSGCRFPAPRGSMPVLRRFGNWLLSTTAMFLFGHLMRDTQSGMWIFRREILTVVSPTERGMAFSEEFKLKVIRAGLRFGEEQIVYSPRIGTSTLAPIRDGWQNLLFLLRFRFTPQRNLSHTNRRVSDLSQRGTRDH